MKRLAVVVVATIIASQSIAFGQSGDVNKILADARAALGGEKKLSAVTTLSATGRSSRVTGDASTAATDVEMAFELPDKFMKKDVLAMMGSSAITRTSGFNGSSPINIIDQPPMGGGMVFIRMGPGGGAPGAPLTPEQEAEQEKQMLLAAKQDFARLLLGILATSPSAYPLQFSYGGQAESPDGKADIIEVKGEGDFAVRLFIDTKTHLPLMLSWMAREPIVMSRTITGSSGAAGAAGGGGRQVVVGGNATAGGGRAAQQMTPEELEKMKQDAAAQAKAAEAKARIVEYRLFYSDYRDVDGVKVPFTMQRSIDGKPSEEVTLDKVKINAKIDPKKFQTK